MFVVVLLVMRVTTHLDNHIEESLIGIRAGLNCFPRMIISSDLIHSETVAELNFNRGRIYLVESYMF